MQLSAKDHRKVVTMYLEEQIKHLFVNLVFVNLLCWALPGGTAQQESTMIVKDVTSKSK